MSCFPNKNLYPFISHSFGEELDNNKDINGESLQEKRLISTGYPQLHGHSYMAEYDSAFFDDYIFQY